MITIIHSFFLENILVEGKKKAPPSQRKEIELYGLELNGRDDFLSHFYSNDFGWHCKGKKLLPRREQIPSY